MKIFVTVGTQEPFDRLIKAVDIWASKQPGVEITAQIGNGEYTPKNMQTYNKLKAAQFNTLLSDSDLIITHAGMGIILKALVEGKPIIVLPRKLSLKELNTDHQIATAKTLEKKELIHVAWDIEDLLKILETPASIKPMTTIGPFASENLTSFLNTYLIG